MYSNHIALKGEAGSHSVMSQALGLPQPKEGFERKNKNFLEIPSCIYTNTHNVTYISKKRGKLQHMPQNITRKTMYV
jgi:hypothetical protein